MRRDACVLARSWRRRRRCRGDVAAGDAETEAALLGTPTHNEPLAARSRRPTTTCRKASPSKRRPSTRRGQSCLRGGDGPVRPQHQGAAGAARSAAYAPRQAARVDAGAWTRSRLNQRQLHELAKRRSGVLWQLRPPREVAQVAPAPRRALQRRVPQRRSCVLETQELWKTLDLTVEAQSEFEQRLARQLEIQKREVAGSPLCPRVPSNCPREPSWASIPGYTRCADAVRVCILRDVDLARLAERRAALGEPSAERLPRYRPRDYHFPQVEISVTAECVQQILVSNPRLQSFHLRCGIARRVELTCLRLLAHQHDAVRVPCAAGYGRFDSRRSLRSHAVRVVQACRGSPA